MHISLINPHVRVAMQSVIPSGYNIARRVIYDYELIYLERGSFTLVYDGKPYICKPGNFIFIRPGIPHSFHIEQEEISQPHIHFDITYRHQSGKIPVSFKDIDAMTESERALIHKDYFFSYPSYPFVTVPSKAEFLEDFFKIIAKETSPLVKKSLLIRLISVITEANFPDAMQEKEPPSEIAHQVKDYIDAGNGFEMSLDDFAKCFFQSKFYLDKRFKKHFGISLIEYRNRRRMELAEEMLLTNSVTATAEKLGFQSIYSFSRAYKRHFGISPKARSNSNP